MPQRAVPAIGDDVTDLMTSRVPAIGDDVTDLMTPSAPAIGADVTNLMTAAPARPRLEDLLGPMQPVSAHDAAPLQSPAGAERSTVRRPPPDYGYGKRWDESTQSYSGAPKGLGYFGPLQRPDDPSTIMSEYSMGVDINGKHVEIPTVVPTLTREELQAILTSRDGQKLPDSVYRKARAHAQERIAAGKDPFAEPGEQSMLYPELPRAPVPSITPPTPATAPPAPAPPRPLGRVGMLTGQPAPPLPTSIPILDAPAEGATQLRTGIGGAWDALKARVNTPRTSIFGQPLQPHEMNAASDTVEGSLKLLEPAFVGVGLANPLAAISALVGSYGASKATEFLAGELNLSPELTRLLSNVAGVVGVGALPASREAVRAGGRWGRARVEDTFAKRTITPEPTDINATAVRPVAGALPPAVLEPPAPQAGAEPAVGEDVTALMNQPPAPPADAAAHVASAKADVADLLQQLEKEPNAEAPLPVQSQAPPEAAAAPGDVAPPPAAIPAAPAAGAPAGEPAGLPSGTPAIGDDVTALVNAPADESVAAAQPPATLENPDGRVETAAGAPEVRTGDLGTRDGAAPPGETPQPSGGRSTKGEGIPRLDPEAELLTRLTQEAVDAGHAGDPEVLYKHLQERADALREIRAEVEAAGGTPQELLREIAKAGGIGFDKGNPGEIAWLWESSDKTRVHGRTLNKTTARPIKSHDRLTGSLGGVPGVLKPKGSGDGLTLDGVVEYLRQDPRFQHIETINDLLDKLSGIAAGERKGFGPQLTARDLGAHGEKWWEKIVPPAESAADQGGPIVYHGTDTDFDHFDRSEDIGFHFGSRETALQRLKQGEMTDGRIVSARLAIKKPLRLPDLHTWSPRNVLNALEHAGVITGDEADNIELVDRETIAPFLERAGYDGIVYQNATEGGGDSYIAIRPEQVKILGREKIAGPADVLDTGEAQPRLPAAGQVRDTETKTPQMEAPFSLTPEAHDAGSVQEDLFRAKPAPTASRSALPPDKPTRGSSRNASIIEDRKPQTSARGTTLESAVVPGLKQFVEQDVVPGAKQAAEDVTAAASDIKTLFAPASASVNARDFAHVVRANIGARDQRMERARRRTKALSKMFDTRLRGAATDKAKAAILLQFTDAVEAGEAKELPPELRDAAAVFRELLDGRRAEIQKLGKLQEYINNYFPHEWAQPNETVNALKRLFGKRPLQGPKSFLKKRSIPTTREGIELGLKPVSYNPVELVLRKLVEMDKFIAATRILKDGQKQGLAKYVAIGDEAPEGWRRFDHSFAVVYGKPTVTIKEAYDKILMEKLEAFAESLGVTHTRKQSLGGSVWGLAHGDRHIDTRFAGPETVLEHEIGHILDERFGLRHGMVNKKLYRQELRDLADLRDEGTPARDIPASRHRYVRKGEEKIANLVHAFIYTPEKAKSVAPNSYWLLYNMAKSTPALHPLIELQKARSLTLTAATTEKPIGGALIKGYYYGPPEVVRLLDNHLAPGLRKSIAFNLYRRAGNFLNQVQLGLSLFHLTMTGMESVISKQSLAFELLSRGKVGDALRKQLEVPVSPIVDVIRGHKLLREFYAADANAQTFEHIIDSVVQAGGGFGWSLFEHDAAPAKFMQALRQGNYPGAALRAIPALIELQAKPIMEGWVPRLKMAAFMDMMRMELPTLGPEPTLAEVRRVAADAWDSVDNRFGQLRYDNLFWHTALKDLGMASVRALGWNIGSIREAAGMPGAQLRQLGALPGGGFGGKGGGGKRPTRLVDVGVGPDGEPRYEERQEPWLHRKTSWLMATVFIYGLAGAIYQYLHTGKGPAELKDYFFPHNGDDEQRVSIPGYPKDWYSALHALPGSLIDTGKHKLNPLLTLLADVYTNEDYFGTAVRNPDDPYLKELVDLVKYLEDEFQAISVKNFRERRTDEALTGKSAGVNAVESFFGVNRAPAAVSRSEAEELVRKFNPPTGRTQEQAERAQLRRQIRQGLQAKTPEGRSSAAAAARSGELSARQVRLAIRGARLTALQAGVRSLTLDQTLRVYDVATEEERALLRPLLLKKTALLKDAAPNDRPQLLTRSKRALTLPYSSKPPVESAFHP